MKDGHAGNAYRMNARLQRCLSSNSGHGALEGYNLGEPARSRHHVPKALEALLGMQSKHSWRRLSLNDGMIASQKLGSYCGHGRITPHLIDDHKRLAACAVEPPMSDAGQESCSTSVRVKGQAH